LNGARNAESQKAIQESLGLVLMLGLAYSASIGGVGTLIGTAPNIVFAGFYKNLYPQYAEITFFEWMVLAIPLVCVFIPLVWVYLCRFVAPIPLKQIQFGQNEPEIIQNELKALGRMNRAEKIIAVVFVSTGYGFFVNPLVLARSSCRGGPVCSPDRNSCTTRPWRWRWDCF
jgi:sodium-dependent dicarboxylate transporter 2/3/5